ncbi:MAG: hypothetical protein FJ109_12145, partial [Deltaproteobacteria bacterium]|nr:hypothetical protein [Deltaproteobacteria bacterium]
MPTQTAVSCLTALLALATACSAEPGNSLPTDLLCAACDSPTGDSTPDADAPDARSPDARMPPLPHGQVLLPPGAFFMGAHPGEACTSEGETPRHQVTLTRGLVAFDHEVTAAEWAETTGL